MSKIVSSVKKTKKLVIVENDWINCGVSSEIISRLIETYNVKFEVKRIGLFIYPLPYNFCIRRKFLS